MTSGSSSNRCDHGVLALILGGAIACGGGPSSSGPVANTATIEVNVSAGAPVSGAQVTVYAINEATGETNTAAGERGVIGRGGPTDASGKALVKLGVKTYAGPIQVVAGGQGVSYVNPTVAVREGSAPRVVQVPVTFEFSSFIASYRSDTPTVVPLSLLTTLADREAVAYARGRHPARPGGMKLTQALSARDPLFVAHFTRSTAAWSPAALRSTVPVMFVEGPATLVDTAYAALYDVALNQLAADVAVQAGYGADSQSVNAITLAQLLEQDIDADGVLDGRAEGGRPVAVIGTPAVAVDSHFLRKSLARSLDGWMRNRAVNKSGISSAELAAAQVYTAISTDTSDLFGAAAVDPFDPIDREPPVVSLASETATIYTKERSITLRVRAEDASDIKGVWAHAGASTYAGVRELDGLWTIVVGELPVVGRNPIAIWGEDAADPQANSGFGVAGRQVSADVVYDPNPPSVTYDSEFASYVDERGMSVATDASGFAVVPPVYRFDRPKSPVARGGEIFKAATRLAGGVLDPGDLEGANGANVPVLRFAAAYNAETDAPLVQANYSVAVTCAGCPALPVSTGALVRSPTSLPAAVNYLLPLSIESVPALAQIVGQGVLNVVVQLADAAGNAATAGPFVFTFHVVGPPIAVAEDPGYPTYGDQWSTFAYGLGTAYPSLWDANLTFRVRNVRLLRYVLTNPAREPVAIAASYHQAPGGSWKAVESWRAYAHQEPGGSALDRLGAGVQFTVDGFTYWQYLQWAYPYGRGLGWAGAETSPWPCPRPYEQGANPAHRIGDTANRFVCAPSDVPWFARDTDVETAPFSTGDALVEIYGGFRQDGRETSAPENIGGMLVIPGATDAGPGTLVLYVTRSPWAPRTRALEWGRGTGNPRFETWDWVVWMRYWKWTGTVVLGASFGAQEFHTYVAYRRGRYLAAVAETLEGSFSVTTRGTSVGSLVGEPLLKHSVTLSRQVAAR